MSGLIVCGVEPEIKMGEPAILVETDADCQECGRVHDMEKCPKCGSWIDEGYGLAFGGMGHYKSCLNEKCDWWWKEQDMEDMPTTPISPAKEGE